MAALAQAVQDFSATLAVVQKNAASVGRAGGGHRACAAVLRARGRRGKCGGDEHAGVSGQGRQPPHRGEGPSAFCCKLHTNIKVHKLSCAQSSHRRGNDFPANERPCMRVD